jgi:hypothetical protein
MIYQPSKGATAAQRPSLPAFVHHPVVKSGRALIDPFSPFCGSA